MHVALWVLAGTSFVGAVVCLLRPRTPRQPPSVESTDAGAARGSTRMSETDLPPRHHGA